VHSSVNKVCHRDQLTQDYERGARISLSTRLTVYQRAGRHCEGCGKYLSLARMNAHHIRPYGWSGGSNTTRNLCCLCKPCHRWIHEHWPLQRSQWHRFGVKLIPDKHRDFLVWIFDWTEFPPIKSSGYSSLLNIKPGHYIQYRWKGKRWERRKWRNRPVRSITSGLRLMRRLIKIRLDNSIK
jgi:hypothetical protein